MLHTIHQWSSQKRLEHAGKESPACARLILSSSEVPGEFAMEYEQTDENIGVKPMRNPSLSIEDGA